MESRLIRKETYMRNCCENCFKDIYLKEYIRENNEIGNCDYCKSKTVRVISTKEIGTYIRECLDKAFEDIDAGTGAMYDSENREYYGGNGGSATSYSVKEILLENEDALEYSVINSGLLEDIFEDSGPTDREIMQGELDKYRDIDGAQFVIINDMYGIEATKMYYSWEIFKHTIKHYNRFFDMDGFDMRKEYLQQLRPYIIEYEDIIPAGTILYRVRKCDAGLPVFDEIDAYKELSPAPPLCATTNRMSPAGISYLYLATDKETACEECRCKNEKIVIAEYVSKEELSIIDFSKEAFVNVRSIFCKEYDHDLRWINQFLENFVDEITSPVDDNKKDHSYEYASTQLIAEYIRSLGYDGICFKSSVGTGNSYVFFCGPDIEHNPYVYGYLDEYIKDYFPILTYFTEWFEIRKIEWQNILEDGRINILAEKEIHD